MGARAGTSRPAIFSGNPALTGTRAMATLSDGCSRIAEFSAVGSLAISSKLIASPQGTSTQQNGLGHLLARVYVQLRARRMNPVSVHAGNWDFAGRTDLQKCAPFHSGNDSSNVHVNVALRANAISVIRDRPIFAP